MLAEQARIRLEERRFRRSGNHLSPREYVRLQRDLRALLQASPRDERAIEAKVAELEALRDQIDGRRRGVLREIQAALTVEQRARFALIQETFEADTIRLLEEVRRLVQEQRRRR